MFTRWELNRSKVKIKKGRTPERHNGMHNAAPGRIAGEWVVAPGEEATSIVE